MTARMATSISEATHRYPTSVHWGEGWFGDGFKYVVAAGDKEALDFHRIKVAGITREHLQKRDGNKFRFLRVEEGIK